MKKRLALNMQSAEMQSGDLFQLTPYKAIHDHQMLYVGSITPLEAGTAEHGKAVRRNCLVRVADSLHEEIKGLGFPGEIDIRFIQQTKTDWLAVFASNRRIVSAYMKLNDSDVKKLIAGV